MINFEFFSLWTDSDKVREVANKPYEDYVPGSAGNTNSFRPFMSAMERYGDGSSRLLANFSLPTVNNMVDIDLYDPDWDNKVNALVKERLEE